jgi:hypothetical protein
MVKYNIQEYRVLFQNSIFESWRLKKSKAAKPSQQISRHDV